MSDNKVPQRFLDLAQQALVPRALTEEGLQERFGDLDEAEIEAGQVWRARWEDIVVLLLIVRLQDHGVIAAPVTVDPSAEDDRCLIVSPALTAFGVDVTLWGGMTGLIPLRVLDRPVDAWNDEIVRWTTAEASPPSAAAPGGTRRGRAIRSSLEPDAMLLAELEDDLDALRHSPALPVASSGQSPPRTLRSLLGPGLRLEPLCSALGWPQYEVMNLLKGKKPLTPDLVDTVAQATGLAASEVAQAVLPLPQGLVIEMDHPRWRPTWRAVAESDGVDEATARMTVSYGTFAHAARQTGTGAPDWRGRLKQFLRSKDPQYKHQDR